MNYGTIRISTNPSGATVRVSGQNKGATPIDIVNVIPGIYNITLSYPGLNSYNFDTVIIDSKMTNIYFDFILQEVSEEHVELTGKDLVRIEAPPGLPEEQPPNIPPPPDSIMVPDTGPALPSPGMITDQVPPATLDNVLTELTTINDNIVQLNNSVSTINVHEPTDYYDIENVITISQPVELDPDSVLYQIESIHNRYGRLSKRLTIYNIGPGVLYVRVSHDGTTVSNEFILYEGEIKTYDNIYDVRLRSPSANLRYRVTEYDITSLSGQTFSGSRFKDRRDRSGVIVFQDDYESPTIKFESSAINVITSLPVPGVIVKSLDTAFAGDFSIKTITGPIPVPVPNDATLIVYRHPDFHTGKVAAQFHFASSDALYLVGLVIDHYTGSILHRADIFFVTGATFGDLFLVNADGSLTRVASEIQTFPSRVSWNVIKLTVDIGLFEYVSAVVNGTRVDLAGIPLAQTPNTTSVHIAVQLQNITPSGGGAKTVYFDNYIFTEDENLE